MKLHELKTWRSPFDAVWDGVKPYEVRKDDRDFQVGDLLRLRDYNPDTDQFGMREVLATVTYKTRGGAWGLPDGLCVLGIRVLERRFDGEVQR